MPIGKIKILFATDGLGNGGKERQLVETLKNISRDKFELGVITFNPNQHYEPVVSNISDYFKVFIKDKNVLDPFFNVFESFEKFKPDVVHSYDLLSSFYTYLPSKLYRCKIVNASIQDSGLDKGWQYKLKKYLISLSDLVLSNSFKGLEYYKTNGNIIYNFIDTERFFQGNHKGEFNAAMVANFSDYKDYDSYLRIVKELLRNRIIDRAYAVGDGKYLQKYKNIAVYDDLLKENLVFSGNIENVELFLNKISIGFLLSTENFSEGISNSVLEYMASGVIPIVSDIGASSEIIDTGIDGYLVNKSDIHKIIEIVRNLKENRELISTLQENAKIKINNKFNMQKNISLLEKYYSDLIAND